MPKALPRMHVGEVHLYEGKSHTNQGISQRNGGVRISPRIENNAVQALTQSQMNAIDERTFSIRLEVVQSNTQPLSLKIEFRLDLHQRDGAVGLRLAQPQEVQVGSLKNKQLLRHRIPERR